MKRTGLIALCLLLAFSLPATAASKHRPYGKKARVHAKAPKPPKTAAHTPMTNKQALAKKQDGDPTQSWQPYSYP
ncbi:MAG: hypothetical protein WC091_16255 [Sulfuricellaceae bacterium]